jgi:hypothetical protein
VKVLLGLYWEKCCIVCILDRRFGLLALRSVLISFYVQYVESWFMV